MEVQESTTRGGNTLSTKDYSAELLKMEGVQIEKLDSIYMRLSQNSQPNSDTPDMNSRKER